MKTKNKQGLPAGRQGFTLIELLVVIAIIGILAALVLVALGNARDKAQDARIKSSIGQLRSLAEIIYDNGNSSYANVRHCFNSGTNCGGASVTTNVATIKADILAANGSAWLSATTTASGDSYCVAQRLKSDNTTYFCADGKGTAKVTTSACSAGSGACP